jgi:Polyketide cyclase / dehydrase and lipid transport
MTKAYYSTIFQQAAPEVWKIIRDFNNYPVWVGGCGESRIEDGKPGETVGAIRDVLYRGRRIRQRPLALSDVERTQTYEFCGAPTLPVTGFQATLRVTPVIDGDRAFVEWWAMFDCEPGQREELATTLSGWFAKWFESLRAHLEARAAAAAMKVQGSDPEQVKFGLVYRLWLRD